MLKLPPTTKKKKKKLREGVFLKFPQQAAGQGGSMSQNGCGRYGWRGRCHPAARGEDTRIARAALSNKLEPVGRLGPERVFVNV